MFQIPIIRTFFTLVTKIILFFGFAHAPLDGCASAMHTANLVLLPLCSIKILLLESFSNAIHIRFDMQIYLLRIRIFLLKLKVKRQILMLKAQKDDIQEQSL